MDKTKVDFRLESWGIINFISPIPVYILTALWGLLIMALFRFDDSVIAIILAFAPMLTCPISCISGCIYGFRNKSQHRKNANMCIALSVAGLIGFVLLIWVMSFLSSIG